MIHLLIRRLFPISRDPPEGGTHPQGQIPSISMRLGLFPISRDPPEGGTRRGTQRVLGRSPDVSNF